MSNTETYIVSAKTVDEAMAIAQREYGGAGKDISFDILEMPKKGFLGIGAKDAKIKVTVTEEEEINLGSIVAEMKSYRMQTDREGQSPRDGGKPEKPAQPKPEKPAQPKQEKPAQPKQDKPAQPKQEKPVQPKQDKPAQPKQEKPAQPKQDKPAQPKQEKPAQPKQEKPAQPKQEKPAQPKQDKPVQPKQDKPVQPKPEKPVQPKPEQKPAQPKAEPKPESRPAPKAEPKQEKPAFDTSRAGEKPVKKEAQATGILDNMPEYKIDENARKTPVYKETGANVKTYSRSPMQTAAVADGSIYSGDTPVADVRWDSARDLKKAEEAAAAAIAAAAPKAVEPIKASEIPVKETVKEAPVKETRRVEEPVEEEYIPSDGSIDVAALDAAIEAMVEDLPAPETRKKVGVTAAEMEHALAFVTTLLANMQIDARAVALPCPEGEEYEVTEDASIYPAMEIVGDGTGILIGHHGETLDAIQYLLNLAAIRHSDNPSGDYVKISLDIENYRAKREETLRSLARRMAARALKYKRNVFLEPMNAYERRIIHSELQSVENVSTHSVGTDKNRKIIITYEGPDKVFDDRRRLSDKPENSGNGRRDRKRRGDRNADKQTEKSADPADLPEEPVMEGAEETAAEKPAGEHKSRSRNRNRNRNRRGRRNDGETNSGENTADAADNGESTPAEAPVTGGAAAIISGEEREAIDRQLSDPANRSEKKPQPKPVEDIPEFLRQPAAEPVEHLREN